MRQELLKIFKSVELAAAATGYRLRVVGRMEKYAKRRCTLCSTVQCRECITARSGDVCASDQDLTTAV